MKSMLLTPKKVLMKRVGESLSIPTHEELAFINHQNAMIAFDAYDGKAYSFTCINEEIEISDSYIFIVYRELRNYVGEDILAVVGRAIQLGFWHRNSTYCGRCGSKFTFKNNELGKICECGNMSYPAAFPTVIVSVRKGDEVLLVKTKYQVYSFFSCVAGFVDPGEKLEDAVAREVMEEVGLTIENITYFDSQPYAPSNNIMIAFTADYKSGEITIDDKEIAEAYWFPLDDLPELPSKRSLGWMMIESYLSASKK